MISRADSHKIRLGRAGRVGQNQSLIFQLHPYDRVGQQLHNNRIHRFHGRVKTQGPSAVTATQCSKWAEHDPSLVTAVHLSCNTRISGPPAFTIGSMASTIPSFSLGFSFLRST
jgi:hypothetical protein